MAKKITLGILIASVLVGLVLLFFVNVDMERFMTYVQAVAYLYVPLVASIGINSGVETIKGAKEIKDEKCS